MILTAQAFEHQKAIGKEIKAVRQLGKRYVAQTSRWGEAVQTCDTAVKELGDFENYFSVLNKEIEGLAELLENFAARKRSQSQSGAQS